MIALKCTQLNDHPELVGRGLVTRLDVAVDVDNVQIDDILFHVPRFRVLEII